MNVAEKPAVKLLSSYRAVIDETNSEMSMALDAQRAKEASATMRSLGPILAPLMSNWGLQQWQF